MAGRIFLGNHSDPGRNIGKRCEKDPFRSLVGLGHRRSVRLVTADDTARVNLHDQRPGLTHRTDKTGKHAAAFIL